MKRPFYLIPFIFVYKIVKGIFMPFTSLFNFVFKKDVKPAKKEVINEGLSWRERREIQKVEKERLQVIKQAEKIVRREEKRMRPSFVKKTANKIKKGFLAIVRLPVLGFLAINYLVYRIFKLNYLAIVFIFGAFIGLFHNGFGGIKKNLYLLKDKLKNRFTVKVKTRKKKLIGDKVKKLSPKERAREEKRQKLEEIKAAKEEAKRKAEAKKLAKQSQRDELEARKKAEKSYLSRQKAYGKKTAKTKMKDLTPGGIIAKIINLPKDLRTWFNTRFENLSFVKSKKSRLALEREALLMSVEEEKDKVKSKVKLLYVYVAQDPEGKLVKGEFEAHSKVEVHSFLLNEGYEVYSIKTNKWLGLFPGKSRLNKTKIKNSDLVFFLTQLSTYIKAGIPLVESLKILSKQYRKKSYQRIFKTIIYDLTMGENLSAAMEKQNVAFPRLLINMVKAAEMTGELPEVLDNMAEYYAEIEKTRKQMVTALIYPVIVVVLSVVVITFLVIGVIPRFVEIFAAFDADQIPLITRVLMDTSDFMQANIIAIFLGILVVGVILGYMFHNLKLFRMFVQWLVMHIPIFKNIVIYNEVTIFSKTFSSLLSHNVFITDSMEVLNSITENEIYKTIILDTINNLAKGEKISESFRGHWAFPEPAYEMLVTGEKTGQLPEMMLKVSNHYQDLHRQAVTRLKTVIEPALIIFLTGIVGVIVLSVVIPMFNMFTLIQQ